MQGSAFSSDFDAAIHLIGELRRLKPDIFINLTTGTYPSPFWLMYADSIWRGGDDSNFAGVGSCRERWITYRDARHVCRSGESGPAFSAEFADAARNYLCEAGATSDDRSGQAISRNEVHDYFGIRDAVAGVVHHASLLTADNWETLAEAAKWSRENASVLADTHWVGGDPRWLEVYGWAAWSPAKAILTLRNPSDHAQDFTVDIASAFELPAGAAQSYSARSPWAADASQAAIELRAGEGHTFHLAPFQVLTLEACAA